MSLAELELLELLDASVGDLDAGGLTSRSTRGGVALVTGSSRSGGTPWFTWAGVRDNDSGELSLPLKAAKGEVSTASAT